MRTESLQTPDSEQTAKRPGLLSFARFEMVLLGLLLLTAASIIWQRPILDRTVHFTPQTISAGNDKLFSDHDAGGGSRTHADGLMRWDCDLNAGNAYPYCGAELFIDRNRGPHGLDLSNMRSFAVTLMYRGPSTSFRVHLKNFDPHYATKADDESPKYMRVEADTTPGKVQRTEFVLSDFGVADWWLRKRKLPPQFGRPQFDNITSVIVETGSEAPLGHHSFDVSDITVRRAILSEAQYYSLVLGVWIVMIVIYLGYRVGNLRRVSIERQMLAAMQLQEAQEEARRDPLTGLLNRRGIGERFDALVRERRETVSVAVMLIDIDHFKRLNDSFGHDFGDVVLSAVGALIGRTVRTVDIVGRWGGEEFIVVCAGIDRKMAQQIAEKLRAAIETGDFGRAGPVTASIGVHWAAAAGNDLAALVAQADKALYAAKGAGRNLCRMYRQPVARVA
ncbi:MAG: GGDEF domain-containing protein [Asticcacaulis sp.]